MPFEEFKVSDPAVIVQGLRILAQAIESGMVQYHSHDVAGGHPSQPNQVELTLYLKSDRWCCYCGGPGHLSKDCPMRAKTKDN